MIVQGPLYLLTFWGSLVCSDSSRRFRHVPLLDAGGEIEPAAFQSDGGVLYANSEPFEAYQIVPGQAGNLVNLRRNGLFLSAEDGERVSLRLKAGLWEEFALVTPDDLATLMALLRNDWVATASRSVVRRTEIAIGERFQLRMGEQTIDLRDNLPLGGGRRFRPLPGTTAWREPARLEFWREGWQLCRYERYRPLVYYCSYGSKALPILSASLRSLRQLGRYDGDVLVIGDADRAELERTSSWAPERLHSWAIPASDLLDYWAVRYLIAEWPGVQQFQPILYVDTDVAFDLDPEPMFVELLLSSKLSAQEESFAVLSEWAPNGADLFREAGIDVSGRKGFNSGVIGIPRIAEHGATLLAIYDMIYRHAAAKQSRSALSHYDQACANYIAVVTESFDLRVLTPFIRWLNQDAVRGGPVPLGLCHLWDSRDKPRMMADYIARLLSAGDGHQALP